MNVQNNKRNCFMFNCGKLDFHFLHINTKLNLIKIIWNNFDYISTTIIKFHPYMSFRLVAIAETK